MCIGEFGYDDAKLPDIFFCLEFFLLHKCYENWTAVKRVEKYIRLSGIKIVRFYYAKVDRRSGTSIQNEQWLGRIYFAIESGNFNFIFELF